MRTPDRAVITGTGKPRFIKQMELGATYAVGTASQSGTTITGVGTAFTAAMVNGNVLFADGTLRKIVTVTDGTHLVVLESGTVTSQAYILIYFGDEYHQTTGDPDYTATTVIDTVALSSKIKVGMRIQAINTSGALAGVVSYAKILSLDGDTKTITVDEWIGGTPTDGEFYAVDGWIADLPRAEKLLETFEPRHLVHSLYLERESVKERGYRYSAKLNYPTYFSPDTEFELRDIMRVKTGFETLYFIPRADQPGIKYEVYFDQAITLALHPTTLGHEGIVISISAKNNIPNPPIFGWGGYGTGYGQDYGNQL